MVILAKIRRMHFRDGMSVREVSRRKRSQVHFPDLISVGRVA